MPPLFCRGEMIEAMSVWIVVSFVAFSFGAFALWQFVVMSSLHE